MRAEFCFKSADGLLHLADAIELADHTAWSSCDLKAESAMLVLARPTCKDCMESADFFQQEDGEP